jgi:tetratricopeptide (TPR) repeat protein
LASKNPHRSDESSAIIRRQLFILLAIALSVAAAWALWQWGEDRGWGNPDRAIRHKMEKAQQALVERRLEDTIQQYAQVISRYPSNPLVVQARMGLASAYEESGRLPEAVEAYQALLTGIEADKSKSDLRAFTQLQIAKLHAQEGNQDQALPEFEAVRKNYPGSDWAGEALEGQGKAWQARRDYKRAMASYRQLIHDFPKGFLAAGAQSAIGECYEAQEQFSKALKAYQTVLDAYPSAVWDDAKQRIEALRAKMDASKEKSGREAGTPG